MLGEEGQGPVFFLLRGDFPKSPPLFFLIPLANTLNPPVVPLIDRDSPSSGMMVLLAASWKDKLFAPLFLEGKWDSLTWRCPSRRTQSRCEAFTPSRRAHP